MAEVCNITVTQGDHFCCTLSQYSFHVGVLEVQVYDLIVMLFCLAALIFLLLKLRPSLRNETLLPVYYNVTVFAVFALVLSTINSILGQLDTLTQSGPAKLVLDVFWSIVLGCQWLIQIGVLVFMFQSETRGPAVSRSVLISVAVTALMVAATMASFIIEPFKMQYLGVFVVEIVQTAGFFIALLFFFSKRFAPRRAALVWAIYQGVTHLLFAFTYGFFLKNSQFIVGKCFDVVSTGLYYMLFTYVFYTTIKHDSIYWRKKGAIFRATELFETADPNQALERLLATGVHIVQWKDLQMRRDIGSGSYGDVYEAKYRGTTVAVKRLRMPRPDAHQSEAVAQLVQEAALFSSIRHPNVVQFMGLCLDPPAIISEFCANGSLWDLIHPAPGSSPPVKLTWDRRIRIMKDVCRGMLYLHGCTPPIIHRDLKSANVLLDENWTAKVCDFGLARVKSVSATMSRVGTPQWMAPELLREERYAEKVDVFSYGVILWELATLERPYSTISALRVIFLVAQSNKRLEIPPDCPPVLKNLIQWCFKEERDRPAFEQIMELLDDINSPADLGMPPSSVEKPAYDIVI